MIISASAGASTPLVTPRTIGTGSPRKVATRPNSSIGTLQVAAMIIERMRADREADRQPLAALEAGEIDVLQVGGVGQVGAHGVAAAQHQPAAADIGLAGRRVGGEVDARGDVGAAVLLMLDVERQAGEVDVVAPPDRLMHRRLRRRHLQHRLRIGHAAHELVRDVALRHAQRRGEPLAAAGDRRDHLALLRPDPLEMGGLRRRCDDGAQVAQRDRLVVGFGLPDFMRAFRRSAAAGICRDRHRRSP